MSPGGAPPGGAGKGGGRPQGRGGELAAPPAEYLWFDPQAREAELQSYTQGPDHTWLLDHHEGKQIWVHREPMEAVATERLAHMMRLDEAKAFESIKQASPHLQSHVRNLVLESHLQELPETVGDVLVQVMERGDRWLSEEAAQILDRLEPSRRGGWIPPSNPAVVVTPTAWTTGDQPGTGGVLYDGQRWEYLDYRDKLQLDTDDGRELQSLLGLEAGTLHEERQCVVLNAVATSLWSANGKPPSVAEVQREAQHERLQLWRQAAEATGALGGPPDRMTRTEADVRIYAHDALAPHHDKDFRYLASFEMEALKHKVLHVWLVDHWGRLKEELVVGSGAHDASERVWLLIYRMHARALQPPKGYTPTPGTSPRAEHPALGWQLTLEEAANEDTT